MSQPSRLRIAVIGSGPSALAVIQAIATLKPGSHVTVFDAGAPLASPSPIANDLQTTREFYDRLYAEIKQAHGLEFPPGKARFDVRLSPFRVGGTKRFHHNEYRGGLSNFWGGTMLPFHGKDFAGWPIGFDDLTRHYASVANLVGIAGERDDLSHLYAEDFVNRPPLAVLPSFRALKRTVNGASPESPYRIVAGANRVALETRPSKANACVACGECMAGCIRHAVFCTAPHFPAYAHALELDWVTARVHGISAKGQITFQDRRTPEGPFDRIYLCAGCVGSAEILMRSLGVRKDVALLDNAIFQFPLLFCGTGNLAANETYVALANLILAFQAKSPQHHDAHAQVYPSFDYLWRRAMPEPMWALLRRPLQSLRDRLLWVRFYTHSDEGYRYALSLDAQDRLVVDEDRHPMKRQLEDARRALREVLRGSNFVLPPLPPLLTGTSSHLAGPFPYGGSLAPLDRSGEIMPNVFVCDAACFPSSPAASPTFTIMANAHRTAFESLS